MAGKDGRVNMREMLERKPLYPAEREADPTLVCVTGDYTLKSRWPMRRRAQVPLHLPTSPAEAPS